MLTSIYRILWWRWWIFCFTNSIDTNYDKYVNYQVSQRDVYVC